MGVEGMRIIIREKNRKACDNSSSDTRESSTSELSPALSRATPFRWQTFFSELGWKRLL